MAAKKLRYVSKTAGVTKYKRTNFDSIPKTAKKLYPIPELIHQLLVTINMYEGTGEARIGPIVNDLRDVHDDLKNVIGTHPDYQDNEGLAKLDKVYKAAGWDNNGLRWCFEHDRIGEDIFIFIVEFTDNDNTKWRIV